MSSRTSREVRVRVFKTEAFAKYARKAGLGDRLLWRAAMAAERGLIDADLGGGVIKQRIAREGGGKSGGFRTLVVFRSGERAIFVYGFAKNERANVSEIELKMFKKLAIQLLSYGDAEIAAALASGVLKEIAEMAKVYKSRALAAIHETAEGLHAAGLLDKRTMREFDEACLTPVRPLSSTEIKALREREGASQAVFARHLNVPVGVVGQWERGEKRPSGASLKLLSLIARHGLDRVA